MSKCKDISTMYTRRKNKTDGRRGWVGWKSEKEISISPAEYGMYISRKRGQKR